MFDCSLVVFDYNEQIGRFDKSDMMQSLYGCCFGEFVYSVLYTYVKK